MTCHCKNAACRLKDSKVVIHQAETNGGENRVNFYISVFSLLTEDKLIFPGEDIHTLKMKVRTISENSCIRYF